MTSPTLVVGLGGFGSAVVLETKRLYQRLPTAYRLPAAFLAIDQKGEIRDPQGELGPEERLPLRQYRASEILENLGATGSERTGWRELLDWFPDGKPLQLINAVEPCGARQYRPLGRLGLFADDEFVDRAIRKGIQRARCADPARDPESTIRVALASSLSGGAGSGMLLDVAHLARRAEEFAYLFAYLSIPGSAPDIDVAERGAANTYAALRELVALRTRAIEFEARYERIRPIHSSSRPQRELFARTYLYSDSQPCDESPSAAQRAAKAIVAQLERRVQGATICSVQGLARLVGESEQKIAGALTFGTSASAWLDGDEALALVKGSPLEADVAQGSYTPAVRSTAAANASANSAVGASVEEAPAPSPSEPGELARWRQKIRNVVEAESVAIAEQIHKRLSDLKESISRGWFVRAAEEKELSSLEELIAIKGSRGDGAWSVNAERLAEHEVFRPAKAKLRIANEQFLKGGADEGAPIPEWAGDTAEGRKAFDNWVELRPRGRWRWIRLLSKRRFAERCAVLYTLVGQPEFTKRLMDAIERCASALLAEQRPAGSRQERIAGATAETGSIPASDALSSESGTDSSNREPSNAVADAHARLCEEHLRKVVGNLREPIFGDREPRPSRRAFLLALVPETFPWPTGLPGLKSALGSVATDLKARSLVEICSGDRLWLVAEDLFNAADNVRLLDRYRSAYEDGELRELYHLDRRWLASLGEYKRPSASEPSLPET
jgi:tubulin-like protein